MENKKYYDERPWLVPKPAPKRDIGKEIITDMPLQMLSKKKAVGN